MTAAALTTAYANNTSSAPETHVRSGWHPRIDRLLSRHHRFLNLRYSEPGYLFRGVTHGLHDTFSTGYWTHCQSDRTLSQLECDLDVFLLSQDPSDALAEARLWENVADAAIYVFPSKLFNEAYARCEAAMLAFAEPGVVFKYPFLVEPAACADMTLVIRGSTASSPARNMLSVPAQALTSRAATEKAVRELLQDYGINPAIAVAAEGCPGGREDCAAGTAATGYPLVNPRT